MGFENFDMASYQKNGILTEKDYNVLSKKVVNAINPIRVNTIRKILEFEALPYIDYTKEELNETLDDSDFSVPLELDNVSIPLVTAFNSNYFPNFELEYANPSGIIDFLDDVVILEEIKEIPLKNVPNNNFHSLAVAAFDIEKSIKEAYKKSNLWKISEDVSIVVEFFIPARISCIYDITVKVIFSFYIN